MQRDARIIRLDRLCIVFSLDHCPKCRALSVDVRAKGAQLGHFTPQLGEHGRFHVRCETVRISLPFRVSRGQPCRRF